jgi:hypothetical protein
MQKWGSYESCYEFSNRNMITKSCLREKDSKESRFCTRREIPNPTITQNEKQRSRAHLSPHRIP